MARAGHTENCLCESCPGDPCGCTRESPCCTTCCAGLPGSPGDGTHPGDPGFVDGNAPWS